MTNQNLEAKVGYEKIGSWYVSTKIPEEVRGIFRDNINGLLTSNLSENVVNSQPHLKYLSEELGKKPYELTLEQRAKLLKEDALKSKDEHIPMTYVEHILVGSTTFITPDPFFDSMFYLIGKPFDCYDKVREFVEKKAEKIQKRLVELGEPKNMNEKLEKKQLERSPIRGDNIVYETELIGLPRSDNTGINFEQNNQVMEDFFSGKYNVLITINYKTREARIYHSPEMLKFWDIKV